MHSCVTLYTIILHWISLPGIIPTIGNEQSDDSEAFKMSINMGYGTTGGDRVNGILYNVNSVDRL